MKVGSFFILGSPRSGTSLFRSLLNSHPELVVPPECGFALWLRKDWEDADWSSREVRHAFAAAVQQCKKFETWRIPTADLSVVLDSRGITGYADAVSCIYEAYGHKRGKRIRSWGDKNNYYVKHAVELREAFPGARFIHIVRDVRDVACSYRELVARDIASKYRPELPGDPVAIAEEWVMDNERLISVFENADVYQRIRYEDVVNDLEPTIRGVLADLGLDDRSAISSEMHLGNMDEPAEFLQWKQKLSGPVDPSSVGRYQKDLSVEERQAIEAVSLPTLRKLGYAVTK